MTHKGIFLEVARRFREDKPGPHAGICHELTTFIRTHFNETYNELHTLLVAHTGLKPGEYLYPRRGAMKVPAKDWKPEHNIHRAEICEAIAKELD